MSVDRPSIRDESSSRANRKKPRSKFAMISLSLLIAVVICCFGSIAFLFSPLGKCIDMFSNQVPNTAFKRFTAHVVEDTRRGQYNWIQTVSSSEAVEALKLLRPKMAGGYLLRGVDSLSSYYEYKLTFMDSGVELRFTFDTDPWPACPDFSITEAEINQYIRLSHVREQ